MVGTIVGGALGGPIGAAIGGTFGALLGAELFPNAPIRGPQITDFRINNSQVGAPVRRLYGSGRIAGTVIWATAIREVERERSEGGMFGIGGQKVVEYEYYATFAMALGQPADAAGIDVRRIWANSNIIYASNELTPAQLAGLEEYDTWNQLFGGRRFLGYDFGSEYTAATAAARKFAEEVITIYRGTEDQLPDPTMQAALGIDDTPAFKGMAYVLFKDFNITPWGGALPNIEFEYVNGPSSSTMVPEYRNQELFTWAQPFSRVTPQSCRNDHRYRYNTTYYDDPMLAVQEALTDAGDPTPLASMVMIGWDDTAPDSYSYLPDWDGPSNPERTEMRLYYANLPNQAESGTSVKGPSGAICDLTDEFPEETLFYGLDFSARDGLLFWKQGYVPTPPYPSPALSRVGQCGGFDENGRGLYYAAYIRKIFVERVPMCPSSPCQVSGSDDGGSDCTSEQLPALPEDDQFCVDTSTGQIFYNAPFARYSAGTDWAILVNYATAPDVNFYEETAVAEDDPRFPDVGVWTDPVAKAFWEGVEQAAVDRGLVAAGRVYGDDYPLIVTSPNFRVLQIFSDGGGDTVLRYPMGPCVPQWSRNYNNSAFWTTAYNNQRAVYLANPSATDQYIPSGLGFGAGFPVTQTWACARFPPERDSKVSLPITVAEVVADISAQCGLSPEQYDVSQLTKELWGYERDRVMSGRDAIEQLRTYAFFDAVESGPQIRFVVRGGASVASLTADELGAHVDGEGQPPAITPYRVNDVELAQQVQITYPDFSANYQSNTQRSGRVVVGEQNKALLALGIVADAGPMKAVTDAVLYDQWQARSSYETSLLSDWMMLEATDPIVVPVDSQLVRVRITHVDNDPRGVMKLRAVREEATAFTPAEDTVGSELPVDPDPLQPVGGLTQLIAIDGPALSQSHNEAGFFVAARGFSSGWAGTSVFASIDDSAYSFLVSMAVPSVMGVAAESMPTGPHTIWDRNTVVNVMVSSTTELLGATEAQVLAGANRFFIGVAGRWELCAFAEAELLELEDDAGENRVYALSTLLRGLQGTEWAKGLHQEADVFVMAETLIRIPLVDDVIGQTLYLKAVSSGGSIDTTASQVFTPQGVALWPYAPVRIVGERQVSGDILIEWIRRTRISGEWRDFVDVPLNEQIESYEVDILDGADVVRTLSSSTQSITYTSAQIVADFGSLPSGIAINVYQLSPRVGRGYAGSGTI